MPRQIDHAARRRLIAQAAFDLIERHGVEVATLRTIAAKAEVSMGAVQRCFRTKAQMMSFVMEHMGEQVTARVTAAIDASGAADAALTQLEQTLLGITALDAASRAETRVWLAFAAQALAHPALAEIQRRQYEQVAELIGLLLTAAVAAGEATADRDVERSTRELMVLSDGLNVQLLFGGCTPEQARLAIEGAVARLRP